MAEASMFELDLYLGIITAWYQAQPRGPHVSRTLRRYVLGTGFAKSVEDRPRLDIAHLAEICAHMLSSEIWQLDGLQMVVDTRGVGRRPKHQLDPLIAWWYPLETPRILGIHYWELANGNLELRLLGKFDNPPPLLFGRFAADETDQTATRPTARQ